MSSNPESKGQIFLSGDSIFILFGFLIKKKLEHFSCLAKHTTYYGDDHILKRHNYTYQRQRWHFVSSIELSYSYHGIYTVRDASTTSFRVPPQARGNGTGTTTNSHEVVSVELSSLANVRYGPRSSCLNKPNNVMHAYVACQPAE